MLKAETVILSHQTCPLMTGTLPSFPQFSISYLLSAQRPGAGMEHQPAGVDLLLLPHPGRLHSRQQHRALDNLRYTRPAVCV